MMLSSCGIISLTESGSSPLLQSMSSIQFGTLDAASWSAFPRSVSETIVWRVSSVPLRRVTKPSRSMRAFVFLPQHHQGEIFRISESERLKIRMISLDDKAARCIKPEAELIVEFELFVGHKRKRRGISKPAVGRAHCRFGR